MNVPESEMKKMTSNATWSLCCQ